MNRHRFNLAIRSTVGYGALAGAASLAIMLVVPSVGHSKEVKISGFLTRDEVRAACAEHGGTSFASSGRFGCINSKAGTQVVCTNGGECTGTVPGRTQPKRPIAIANGAHPFGGTMAQAKAQPKVIDTRAPFGVGSVRSQTSGMGGGAQASRSAGGRR